MPNARNHTRKNGPRAAAHDRPLFGAHMSVAGGFENAFEAGKAAESDCLQVFVKNQRQWNAKPLAPEQITAYKEAQRATGLAPVVAHASYLLNLASPASETRERSERALIDELQRCEALGVSAAIFHPGAHMDDTEEAGIKRIAASLDRVTKTCAGFRTRILLESTAGQGTALGWRFEQLGAILKKAKRCEPLGICLDTCHLFAAGYDFRTPEGYAAMMEEFDAHVGLERIECVHTNDSKKECGSRVDRHDHIGKGKIGKEGFRHFVSDPNLFGLPFILETPKGKDGRGSDLDKVNIKRLRKLLS